MSDKKPTCGICGQGGYWVAWSEPYKGWRCVNHIQTPRTSGLCLACGMVCTDPTHEAACGSERAVMTQTRQPMPKPATVGDYECSWTIRCSAAVQDHTNGRSEG